MRSPKCHSNQGEFSQASVKLKYHPQQYGTDSLADFKLYLRQEKKLNNTWCICNTISIFSNHSNVTFFLYFSEIIIMCQLTKRLYFLKKISATRSMASKSKLMHTCKTWVSLLKSLGCYHPSLVLLEQCTLLLLRIYILILKQLPNYLYSFSVIKISLSMFQDVLSQTWIHK